MLSPGKLWQGRQEDRVLFFKKRVNFLTHTYVTPFSVKRVPYYNAYGSQWECSWIFWNIPDGTQITAFETSAFDKDGKLLAIVFQSKGVLYRQTPETKPNPYW